MSDRGFALLLVDDDPLVLASLRRFLRREADLIRTAGSAAQARAELSAGTWDLVILDLQLPDGPGLDLIPEIRALDQEVPVLVLSGTTRLKDAVQAIRSGATDVLQKPFEPEQLIAQVRKLRSIRELARENRRLRRDLSFTFGFRQLIGESAPMLELKELIARVALSDESVLITGETGTGKELVARAIHHLGGRARGPFVVVDATTMSDTLVESELFGHVKGAFTGADRDNPGLIRSAEGGTLFFDEIGDLPLGLQAKLLRFLADHRVRPVGSNTDEAVDVRILAATNRDLATRVQDGSFREDLYFRLRVISIRTAPLRARRGDVPLLARHFLERFAADGQAPRALSPEAEAALSAWHWPGNVRELENAMRRAVAIGLGSRLELSDLSSELRSSGTLAEQQTDEHAPITRAGDPPEPAAGYGSLPDPPAELAALASPEGEDDPLDLIPLEDSPPGADGADAADAADAAEDYTLAGAERRAIERALAACNGHREEAARLLGIGTATLYRRLREFRESGQTDPAVPRATHG